MVPGSPHQHSVFDNKIFLKTLASEVTGFLFEMEIDPLWSPGHPSAMVQS